MNNKNIFLAGIFHETHTFLDHKTILNDFIIYMGSEIINKNIGILFLQFKWQQDLRELLNLK